MGKNGISTAEFYLISISKNGVVMKKFLVLLIIAFNCLLIQGQTGSKPEIKEGKIILSGMLSYDSKISFEQTQKIDLPGNIGDQKKSVWLGAGLSAIVPGAGQLYSEHYIEASVFAAVEAAAITVGILWTQKGNNQTAVFQNYANQHWSVEFYAKWTLQHATSINADVKPADYKVFDSNGNLNWSELNRLESALGSYYSHHLPYYGEQQYYELIGKYQQFAVGWDQFWGGGAITPDKLNLQFYYVEASALPQQFLDYAAMRGEANDFYKVAATAVSVIVINHILSAIDAAWAVSRYNKNLEIHTSMEKYSDGVKTVFYPQLNLQYRF